jgi:broad specificity phosphatase PhoE
MQNWHYLAIMRHGHSHANAAVKQKVDAHFYPVSGSDQAIELDERGELEVACAAKFLNGFAGLRISQIWTSPFKRVVQTSERLVAGLGYAPTITQDQRLAKRDYGAFWNLTYRGVEELFPEEHKKFVAQGKLLYRPPGGENYEDLFQRVDGFYDSHVAPSKDTLLVVTHLAVVLALQGKLDKVSHDEIIDRYDNSAVANGTVRLYRRAGANEPWQFFQEFVPVGGPQADPAPCCREVAEVCKTK